MARPSGRRTSQFKLSNPQPQPKAPSIENNFIAGLKTEFTGLNFPEHASTDTQNCSFFRTGNVTRRKGFDYEPNALAQGLFGIGSNGISSFIWTNAGGDGQTKLYVIQSAYVLVFYRITAATVLSPMSTTLLNTTVTLTNFVPDGGTFDNTQECQYSSGNGYLFVNHPSIDPVYCTFSNNAVTVNRINVQIRDFTGIAEPSVPDNVRPTTLSSEHAYNLHNQGWTNQPGWSSSYSIAFNTLVYQVQNPVTITVATGLTITTGDPWISNVLVIGPLGAGIRQGTMSGIVNTYTSGSGVLSLNVTAVSNNGFVGRLVLGGTYTISKGTSGFITDFFTAALAYPSNSDIWYTFKNSSGVFSPSTTLGSVALGTGPAPKGEYILNAFSQQRSAVSGIGGLTDVTTLVRPTTGAFFQGRVWFSGVNASQPAMGDEPFYTWAENIYFSQIVQDTSQFGRCYQNNDPTSETLPELLPTDGGVIQIQGCGAIYKLFPLQVGLLVFASNGIWFITGGQGIGFTATDFTVQKISGVQPISASSIIDVQSLPIFWAGDAIYMITSGDQNQVSTGRLYSGLSVQNLSLTTIQSFFNNIPTDSKKYARGDYNPITGQIQWLYRSTQEAGISNRYVFDSILNFSVFTQAFYPWTLPTSSVPLMLDAKYITYTQPNSPPPLFKYLTVFGDLITFSEEREDSTNYEDWVVAGAPTNFTSYFVTNYKLAGQAQRKFQPQYIYIYNEISNVQYTLQGVWDFALSNLSNKFTSIQYVRTFKPYFAKTIRKHRITGNGYVLQFKVSSIDGQPFNIAGWSVDTIIGTP